MSEAYYDEHIAPKLMAIAKECEDNGLSLVACYEYELGRKARTMTLQPGCSFVINLVEFATRSRGNIDSLIMALCRYAEKHGHCSIYLNLLGVKNGGDK